MMWKKYVRARQATDGNITQRMRLASCVTTATDTHSQYVILIAIPRQQWFGERASILLLHVQCLSCYQNEINCQVAQNVQRRIIGLFLNFEL